MSTEREEQEYAGCYDSGFKAGTDEERRRCAELTCVYCAGDKVDSMWEPMPINKYGTWVHIFRNELLNEEKLGSNGTYEAPCYAGKIWAGLPHGKLGLGTPIAVVSSVSEMPTEEGDGK